jgi:hypothetical protein
MYMCMNHVSRIHIHIHMLTVDSEVARCSKCDAKPYNLPRYQLRDVSPTRAPTPTPTPTPTRSPFRCGSKGKVRSTLLGMFASGRGRSTR